MLIPRNRQPITRNRQPIPRNRQSPNIWNYVISATHGYTPELRTFYRQAHTKIQTDRAKRAGTVTSEYDTTKLTCHGLLKHTTLILSG